MPRINTTRDVCDLCVEDEIDEPLDATDEYDVTIVDPKVSGVILLCQIHNMGFAPYFNVLISATKRREEEQQHVVPAQPLAAAPEPAEDSTATPNREEPAAIAVPEQRIPRAVATPQRQPPVEQPKRQESLLPPMDETPKPRYKDVVCVACRDAGEPPDIFRVPYRKRREHATQRPHQARVNALVWEGEELRFPCTQPDHEDCLRTGYAFPSQAMLDGHVKSEGPDSAMVKARAIQQAGRQAKLRASGVPLVVCPLKHDFDGAFAVALTSRSGHAKDSHGLHIAEIDWVEDGTPLPFVCASDKPKHRKCCGRLGFPTEEALSNHYGYVGAARNKMIQAGALLPTE